MGAPFQLSRNPLAYPAGARPGFDPAHIASGLIPRLSAVANGGGVGGGNFVNLLTGAKGVPTSFGAQVDGALTTMGKVTRSVNLNTRRVLFGVGPSTLDTILTLGVIFSPSSAGIDNQILSTDGTNGHYIAINTSDQMVFRSALSTIRVATNLTVRSGGIYFAAISSNSSNVNFVLLDLMTGVAKLQTTAANGPGAFTSANVQVGCWTTAGASFAGDIAAVMYSAGKFLSPWELRQWAADPWSFWYPNPGDNWIAAQAAGFPWWAVKNNHMILGAN